MKVLHISDHWKMVGGAERYLHALCHSLNQSSWETPVVVTSGDRSEEGAGNVVQVIHPSYGLRSALRVLPSFSRLLDAEKPDLVHLHNSHFALSPYVQRYLRARLPVVRTVHDTRLFCPRWFSKVLPRGELCAFPMGRECFRHGCYPFSRTPESALKTWRRFMIIQWEKREARRLRRVIVSSEYMRRELARNGFRPERVVKIPLFPMSAAPDRRTARQGKTKTIVFAGRLDETKGIREFLEGLTRLRHPCWQAKIAGDGVFLNTAQRIVTQAGMQDKVAFMGLLATPDLTALMQEADLFVMPSMVPESFGLSGLEALACGVPVIAFDSGGIREWLIDGVCGALIPRGDVEALARRMSALLADEAALRTLGENGRAQAARFSREAHVSSIRAMYVEVLREWKQ